MADLGTMVATIGITTRGIAKAQAELLGMVQRVGAQVDTLNAKLGVTATAGAKMATGIAATAAPIRQMDANISKTADSLKTFTQHLGINAQRLRTFGYMYTAFVTMPVVAAGRSILMATKDYEFSMQKMVGLAEVAQGQVDEWKNALLELGPQVAKSPKELAEALYFISSSGIQGARALHVLELAAKGATAGLGDTQEVADLLTSVLNAYAGTGMTAGRAADILVAAVREGKGEADAFARSMGQIIPIAANLGVAFDQVAGGMAAITLTGASAQNAAVYLKGFFNVLQKAPPQGEKALAKVGASYAELRDIMSRNIGGTGLIDAMERLRELSEMTEKHRMDPEEFLSDVIPNIRGLTAELSIAGKNFKYNSAIMQQITNSAGALSIAFEGVSTTLKIKLDRALSKSQAALIELGQTMGPAIIQLLDNLVKKLEKATKWWNSLSEAQQQAKLRTVAILAVLGPLSMLLSSMAYLLLGVIGGVKGFYTALKWLFSTRVAMEGFFAFFTGGLKTVATTAATTAASMTAMRTTMVASTAGTAAASAGVSQLGMALGRSAATSAVANAQLTSLQMALGNTAAASYAAAQGLSTATVATQTLAVGGAASNVGLTQLQMALGKTTAAAAASGGKSVAAGIGMASMGVAAGVAAAEILVLIVAAKLVGKEIKKMKEETKKMKEALDFSDTAREMIDEFLDAKWIDTDKIAYRIKDDMTGLVREIKVPMNALKTMTKDELEDWKYQIASAIALRRKEIEDIKENGDAKIRAAEFVKDRLERIKKSEQTVTDIETGPKTTPTGMFWLPGLLGGQRKLNKEMQKQFYLRQEILQYTWDQQKADQEAIKSKEQDIAEFEAYYNEVLAIVDKLDAQATQKAKAKALAEHIQDIYDGVEEGEKAVRRMATIFGGRYDKNAAMVEVYRKALEDLAQTTEDWNSTGVQNLIKKLRQAEFAMQDLTYATTEIRRELEQNVATTNMKEGVFGIDFNEAEEMMGVYESAIGDLLKSISDSLRINPFQMFNVANNPDLLYAIVLLKQYKAEYDKLKEQARNAEDVKSLRFLEAQAEAFGGMENQLEVLNAELQIAERRLRRIGEEEGFGENFVRQADTVNQLRQAVKDLNDEMKLTAAYDKFAAMGDSSALVDLLAAKIDVLNAKLEDLSNMKLGNTEEFKQIAKDIRHLEVAQDTIETLEDAFADFFMITEEGFDNFGDYLKDWMKNVIRSFQQLLAELVAKKIMAYLISLLQTPNVQSQNQSSQFVAAPYGYIPEPKELAKGGVIPPGYPNDTYPAMLSSGEVVVPVAHAPMVQEMLDAPKYQKGTTNATGGPAWLTSGEMVLPQNIFKDLEQKLKAQQDSKFANEGLMQQYNDAMKKWQQYLDARMMYENTIQALNDFVPLKTKDYFKVKDIEDGQVGIRHGTKVNKQILTELAKASAIEGAPLLEVLTTAMRESGIGYITSFSQMMKGVPRDEQTADQMWYRPQDVMQSWSSDVMSSVPKEYEQWRMRYTPVDKKDVLKTKRGYILDEPWEEKGYGNALKYGGEYLRYLESFNIDTTLYEPFRKELRLFMQKQGQAYNPGETERAERMAKDRDVILKNKDLYNYADSVYRANLPTVAGKPMMTGAVTQGMQAFVRLFNKKQKEKAYAPVAGEFKNGMYELPEVNIEEKSRYGELSTYLASKYNERNKNKTWADANILGGLFEPISMLPQIPQLVGGKLFTGKHQTPSEAYDLTGVKGLLADMVIDPLNIPIGGIAKSLLKVPGLSKIVKIPGITVDAPELGYHALNAEHWALHPEALLGRWNTRKASLKDKDIQLLYIEAMANRLMPILKHTPLINPIRKKAEAIMKQSSSPFRDYAMTFNKSVRQRDYTGVFELMGEAPTDRNLINLYLYGDERGFSRAGEGILDIPLPERYKKLYPKAKKYILNSRTPHDEAITLNNIQDDYGWQPTVGLPYSIKDEWRNVVRPIDNVAGHMQELRKVGENDYTLITQDLWKFNPKDYAQSWGTKGWHGETQYQRLNAEKQAALLDKVGYPFYLVQNNPVEHVKPNIIRPSSLRPPVITPEGISKVDLSVANARKWMSEWYNDPVTLKKIDYERAKWTDMMRRIQSNEWDLTAPYDLDMFKGLRTSAPIAREDLGLFGYYTSKEDKAFLNPFYSSQIDQGSYESGGVHELMHWLLGKKGVDKSMYPLLQSPFYTKEEFWEGVSRKPDLHHAWLEYWGGKEAGNQYIDYFRDPDEVYARIAEWRKATGVRPNQYISLDMVQRVQRRGVQGGLFDGGPAPEFFYLMKDPRAFQWLLNTLPAAGGMAIGGAAFAGQQKQNTIPGLQHGGVIPEGFPNDTFPAMLTSGEIVIPNTSVIEELLKEMQLLMTKVDTLDDSLTTSLVPMKAIADTPLVKAPWAGWGETMPETGPISTSAGGGDAAMMNSLASGLTTAMSTISSGGNAQQAFTGATAAIAGTGISTALTPALVAALGPAGVLLAPVIGNLAGMLLGKMGGKRMAEGGIVPPGYNNDTFHAMLSSNEAVIPLTKLNDMIVNQNSDEAGVVEFHIAGDELVGIHDKRRKTKSKF